MRPKAELGEYKGLEVGRREPRRRATTPIDQEIEQLRERARPPGDRRGRRRERRLRRHGLQGLRSTASRSRAARAATSSLELGSGRLIPGFEEQLTGAKAGEDRKVEVTFPADYGAEHLAGKDAVFEVTVKEVKRKDLPELDDDFARRGRRLRLARRAARGHPQAPRGGRDAGRSSASSARPSSTPPSPTRRSTCPTRSSRRARKELLDQTLHSLSHQGIDKETYLRIAGKTEEELLEEAKPDAEQALRREAVLTAIVEAEGIEVSDEEVLEALGPTPSAAGAQAEEAARPPAQRGPPGRASRRTWRRARRSTSLRRQATPGRQARTPERAEAARPARTPVQGLGLPTTVGSVGAVW